MDPVDVMEDQDRSHKFNFVLLFILVGLLTISLSADAKPQKLTEKQARCYKAVKEKEYSSLFMSCTETYGQSLEEMVRSGRYFSYLGTLDELSPSGELLKSYAASGERLAQYAFADAQKYLSAGNQCENSEALVREKQLLWFGKAGDQGHLFSMMRYILEVFGRTKELPTQEVHERGQSFAEKLVNHHGSHAKPLLELFASLPHQNNAKESFFSKLDKLDDLPVKKIKELKMAFLTGRYYFASESGHVFDIYIPSYKVLLDIPKDRSKYEELVSYLAIQRMDPESNRKLALIIDKQNSNDVLKHLKIAMEMGDAGTFELVARYLGCNGHESHVIPFLNIAIGLGSSRARDTLADFEDYQNIYKYDCPKLSFNEELTTFLVNYNTP